jgi:hypothetical protein
MSTVAPKTTKTQRVTLRLRWAWASACWRAARTVWRLSESVATTVYYIL